MMIDRMMPRVASPRVIVVGALLFLAAWASAGVATADDQPDWKNLSKDESFWSGLLTRNPDAGAAILFHQAETEVQILEGRFALVTKETIVEAVLDPQKPGARASWQFPETDERKIRDLAGHVYRDGDESSLGGDNVRDLKPYEQWKLYDGMRTKEISFPDPQARSILEVEFKTVAGGGKGSVSWGGLGSFDTPGAVTTGPGGGAYLLHVHHFDGHIPTETSRYTVVFPPELASGALAQRWVTWGKTPDPVTERFYSPDGERVRVRWEGGTRPAVPAEPLMPPWNDVLSYVALSPSGVPWKELSVIYYREYLVHALTVDRTLEGKVKELVKSISDPGARARAIFNYVSNEIAFVDLPLFDSNLEPHAAREVMEAGHGDGRDQAILLVALLRGAGLTADPAAVRTNPRGHLEEGLVTLCQFDHMIGSVLLNGERVWLDPTERGLPFGDLPAKDQGARALLLSEGGADMIELPAPSPGAGKVTRVFTGKLTPDGALAGTFHLEASGQALAGLDFLRGPNPDVSNLLAVDPGAATWGPPRIQAGGEGLTLDAELTLAPGAAASVSAGDSLALAPFFARTVFLPDPLPEGPRRNPVQWGASVTETDSVRVEMTGGLVWPEASRRKGIGAPIGRCGLRYALEGTTIVASREIDLRRGEWDPEVYERLRDFTVRVPEESARPLLLGRP